MEQKKKESILMKDGVSYLVPFILITSCFALWGFANDITNPMVKAFSKIFRMSSTDGALVQVAFYGGYFAMAFPAAIFIRRFSYTAGIRTLCLRCIPLLSGKNDGRILSISPRLLHPDLRTLLPGDIEQPLHSVDGNGGDGNTPTQSGAIVQPDGFAARYVCGDELYTGKTQPA